MGRDKRAKAEPQVSLDYQPLSHGPSSWVLRYRIHSATHRLCWQAPMFLLPGLAGVLYWRGLETACYWIAGLWLVWSLLGAPILGAAIATWGERFLCFDFSPNPQPTVIERRIARWGQMVPVAIGMLAVGAGVALDGFHDIVIKLGVGFAVAVALIIPGGFVLPFLVMVCTAFRVRPVIDEN
ncbi:MAG: hypothetical protein ACM3Q1_13215 [Bacteroidales bacterium]